MGWPGAMECVVQNNGTLEMTNVAVTHIWTDFGAPDEVTAASMSPGASVTFTINVGPGGSDLWTVTFTSDNTLFTRQNKQCDVEEEDESSGSPVTIALNVEIVPIEGGSAPGATFSVITPVSSPCLDNEM